ncbi:MAG: TonB C-terminal domain-containing protein [Terriglobales bacterium]
MAALQTYRTGWVSRWGFSVALHGCLAALIIGAPWLGKYLPLGGLHPGTASAGAITADLVTKLPGGAIPIPSPVVTPTENRLANDLPGIAISKPRPPRAAAHSVPLPSYNPVQVARQQAALEARELARADELKKKDNRVAYGAGGRVSFSATTSAQGSGGGGGVSFGDANFGNLYSAWVNHLRDRLQYYWNQQPRDPVLPAGIKVTVTMTVHADGQIAAIRYVSRTNSVEVNNMAYTAVEQMAQLERFPLPAGYQHHTLVVTATFELN